MRKLKRRTRILLALGAAFVVGFVLLNILAYNHAYAMLHFTAVGDRTTRPEALSLGGKIRVLFGGVNVPRPVADSTPAEHGLVFEEFSIPCEGGVTLSAWHIPADGATTLVLMFHGYAAEKSSLLDEAKILHDLGCAVALVDFRGSGGSSESYTTVGYREAIDVGAAAAYARARWPKQRLVLYGQSMGAAAMLRAIDAHQLEADGIILEAVFDTLLNTVKNRFDLMGVPSFPNAQLLTFWGGRRIGANVFKHNPKDYARSVKCPALVMHGANDPRAKLAEGRRVYDALTGPKEFVEFPGAAHEPYAVRNPEKWQAAIDRFLRELDSPKGKR